MSLFLTMVRFIYLFLLTQKNQNYTVRIVPSRHTTLKRRHFNVLTSQQRPYNVVLTSCPGWFLYVTSCIDFFSSLDPTLFFVLVGCLSAFLLVILLLLYIYLRRRRKNAAGTGKGMDDGLEPYLPPLSETKDEDNNLLFVFNTITERQQSSMSAPYIQRSCPNSPDQFDDFMLYSRSASYLDLVQPKVTSTGFISAEELDLQMYKDEVQQAESHYNGLGRILISLLYDPNQEILCTLINCGENLESKNNNSSVSPYLKVCLLPDKKRRMHSKTRKGPNPVFDEEFVFSVPSTDLGKRILRIAVCDFDRFARQTIIGYVMVRMEDYREKLQSKGDTGEFWLDLQDNDALVGCSSIC